MLATAKEAAKVLGLHEHQTIYVSHNDEPQAHVHVLVNRVHPLTGKAATLSRSKEKLAAWALQYEKTHGKICCRARESNANHRSEKRPQRERNPVIQNAWRQSDSGRGFAAALKAQGFTLAQGNRRFVVVDRWGKAINPVRHLPDVRAAAFNARLSDIDIKTLPTAAVAQREAKTRERRRYHANRNFEKWSAEYLNKNQDRQNDERAALNDRYARNLAEKKEQLSEHYKLDKLKESIAALRERADRPSLFRRLSGGAAKDRAALEAQELQFQDAERRMGEHRGAIAGERDFAAADLTERHARENELAKEYIAARKPEFYREEQEDEQERQERPGRGGNRDRGRDEDGGRERVRYRRPPQGSPGI
jgi:hypothetical protein